MIRERNIFTRLALPKYEIVSGKDVQYNQTVIYLPYTIEPHQPRQCNTASVSSQPIVYEFVLDIVVSGIIG